MKVFLGSAVFFILITNFATAQYVIDRHIFELWEDYKSLHDLLLLPPDKRQESLPNTPLSSSLTEGSWQGRRGMIRRIKDNALRLELSAKMRSLYNSTLLNILLDVGLPAERVRFYRYRSQIGEMIDRSIYSDIQPVFKNIQCKDLHYVFLLVEDSILLKDFDFKVEEKTQEGLDLVIYKDIQRAVERELNRRCGKWKDQLPDTKPIPMPLTDSQ